MDTCDNHIQQSFINQGRPSVCQIHKIVYPFLASVSIACLPAHFFSCSRTVAPAYEKKLAPERGLGARISMKDNGRAIKKRSCDVLIYNADRFGRLDSYTHFDGVQGEIQVSSGEGEKTAFVICNAPDGLLKWENILSIRSLASVCSGLEMENPEYPVLAGKADFHAGEDCSVTLEPLMARVRLKELSCDFRGTAYPFEELTDIRVYLTNVNADCSVTGEEERGSRFINNGGWSESDAMRFRSPELLCRNVDGNVGMDPKRLDIDLYCYPNTCGTESFGKPFTRLVIEGKVRGRRWYWPINLNSIGDGGGIRRNSSIGLKVCLRRSGTDDPDFAISMDREELVMEIEKWEEKEDYAVVF